MLQRNLIYTVDVNKPAAKDIFDIFIDDKEEIKIIMKIVENGEPVEIDGADVSAYMMFADRSTYYWAGSATGDVATVTMQFDAHRVEGHAQLAIRLAVGEVLRTVFIANVNIRRVSTDSIIDPSDTIPSLEELLEQIRTIEQVKQAAATATVNANTAATAANNAATRANDSAAHATTVANDYARNGVRVDPDAETQVVKIPDWGDFKPVKEKVEALNSLPNPNALTFTGAVSATYDGSKPVAVHIPEGGSGDGTGGGSGKDGATFFPTVSEEGIISWHNDMGKDDPPSVNIKGPKGDPGDPGEPGTPGQNGATFTPNVDANGDLTWTNNAGLVNPPKVNIKGPKGDSSDDFITDSTLTKQGEAADAKTVGERFTEVSNNIGILDGLETNQKTSLVAAINETFTSVSEGKTALASALADMGQTVDAGATFAVFAAAIRAIAGGGGGSIDIDGVEIGTFVIGQVEDSSYSSGYRNTVYVPHHLGVVPKLAVCVLLDHLIQPTRNVVISCIMRADSNGINRNACACIVRGTGNSGYGSITSSNITSRAIGSIKYMGQLCMTENEVSFTYASAGEAWYPDNAQYIYIMKK